MPSEMLARRIRETRKARGLTQQRLAEMMRAFGHQSMTGDTVSEIELGRRAASLDEWLFFAAALRKAPLRLLTPSSDDDTDVLIDRLYQSKELRNWIVYGDPWLPPAREAQRVVAIGQTAAATLDPKIDETRRSRARTRLLDLVRR